MIGKRTMSRGGERIGDDDERPRRGMEVVACGSAFSCSTALSPGSCFCLGRKRVGFGLFGKPGFGRQTKTFYSIQYNTRMETRWTLFKTINGFVW
ncbi:hypothetical protein SLA2020_339880 [Shorea laevis]